MRSSTERKWPEKALRKWGFVGATCWQLRVRTKKDTLRHLLLGCRATASRDVRGKRRTGSGTREELCQGVCRGGSTWLPVLLLASSPRDVLPRAKQLSTASDKH